MLDRLADNLLQFAMTFTKHDLVAYCQLETPFDAETFITDDGGLLTIFQIEGARAMPGDDESKRIFEGFYKELSSAIRSGDHTFGMVFDSDPDGAERELRELYKPSIDTAKRLKLDMMDVIDDDLRAVAKYCSRERAWLTVSTSPTMLSKRVLKKSLKDRQRWLTQRQIPFLTTAQNPLKLIPELVNPHESLINTLHKEMTNLGLMLRPLNVNEACREIRMVIDADGTDSTWAPRVPFGQNLFSEVPGVKKDKVRESPPIRHVNNAGKDASHAWYPSLGRQLIPRSIETVDHPDLPGIDVVRIGEYWYAPLVMEEGPQEPEPFINLFRRMPAEAPWRVCFEFRPGGLQSIWFKDIITSIFGWMGETNKRIRKAIIQLKESQARDPDVGFRCIALTWAKDPKELGRRMATISRALQGWGKCQITDSVGDPIEGLLASVPGLTSDNPGISMAAPLSDVVGMMPFQRPASPWRNGALPFRTPDGKLYPVDIGSSLQDAWVELFFAPMGAGKSMLMNTVNKCACLAPGLTDLPWIVVIDVGPSSSGFISLIQHALPPEKRHLVGYYRLRMTPECAINPFDTQLGCRLPSPMERDFLVNFLSLLATMEGKTEPLQMAANMAAVIVDEIYKLKSDENEPTCYEPNQDPLVDQTLDRMNFRVEKGITTWWEVVDTLFAAGHIHEATVAQRYAVPTLAELMKVVKGQVVRDLFAASAESAVDAGNGQRLVDAFALSISSALREFPVLAGATKFDIGDTRILSLDLDEVARDSKRRAAVMYMLARHVATRNFYLMKEMLSSAPSIYHAYHQKRVQQIKEEKKTIAMDELHRTGGMMALRNQLKVDIREGRKWNIRLSLSSQLLDDFDDEMIQLATSIYILKPTTPEEIQHLKAKFGLSNEAARRIGIDLLGPREEGANFLGIFNTRRGRYVQVLTNTVGAISRWALTTVAEEMGLRNRFYAVMDHRKARKLLATRFPNGAANYIEMRKLALGDEDDQSVLDAIFREIMQEQVGSAMAA